MRKYKLDNKVIDNVAWNPNREKCLLLVTNEEIVYIIQPALYQREANQAVNEVLDQSEKQYKQDALLNDKKEQFFKWEFLNDTYERKMVKITF